MLGPTRVEVGRGGWVRGREVRGGEGVMGEL